MQDVSVPGWVVVAAAAGLVLVVALLAISVVRVRRRVAERLDAAAAEAAALRVQVEEIRRRLAEPPAVGTDPEFVITDVGTGALEARSSRASRTVDTVPAPLFADILLRETVVQAAALAAVLRRALAPEVRNRIRFEMRREVKRARKQRRADLRAARRDWEARQRARFDLDEDATAGSAA